MAVKVFISFSSKDKKVAQTICSALESRGLPCWIASRDVGPGENFMEEIVRAIRAARAMVLVFSENANNSDEIKREIVLAGHSKVIVIPVRVEDVVPADAFAYQFATRQWIDLFEDWESQLERLVASIASIPPPTAADAAVAPSPTVKPELQHPAFAPAAQRPQQNHRAAVKAKPPASPAKASTRSLMIAALVGALIIVAVVASSLLTSKPVTAPPASSPVAGQEGASTSAPPPSSYYGGASPAGVARTVKPDVSQGYLALRAGPGQNYAVVAHIPAGRPVIVQTDSCRPPSDQVSKYPFCRVNWDQYQGWASSNGLE